MTIEEKAKAYDNVREKIAIRFGSNVAKEIFSEYEESEGEKIRKTLIDYFKNYKTQEEIGIKTFFGIPTDSIIAWLEKQDEKNHVEWNREDEQNLNTCLGYIPDEFLRRWLTDIIHVKYDKSVDKVEPKFKAGDWVVYECGEDSATLQIKNIVYGTYEFTDDSILNVDDENTLRLWTIDDAKNGDVLANKNGAIFINAGSSNGGGGTLDCYCYLSVQNEFCIEEHKTGSWLYKDDIKPATKEQCKLLLQKMKEAGWFWNTETKELSQSKDSFGDVEQKVFDNLLNDSKQLWSEEDERLCQCLIRDQEKALDEVRNNKYGHSEIISDLKEMYRERIDWLESLKQRLNK